LGLAAVRKAGTRISFQSVVGNRNPKLFSQLNELYGSASIVLCVDTIIGVSRPRDGGWSSLNRGVLIWRTPSGRTYATTPTDYTV